MARLSNLLRRDDGEPPPPKLPLICRPAQRHEIDRGLKLLLAGSSGPATEAQVLDFLSFALHRKVDCSALWTATRGSHIEWAMLPIVSPGRTMLLLSPGRLLRNTPAESASALVEEICSHYALRDVHLAQLLLDPEQATVRSLYESSGFHTLAELVYLQRPVRRPAAFPELPAGFQLVNYSETRYPLFREAVARSYRDSLDCPSLNGMRDIDDVLAGHMASGEFDPALWFAVIGAESESDLIAAPPMTGDEPAEPSSSRAGAVGVLLLNRSTGTDGLELVYLGLDPSARGKGLADALMGIALASVHRDGRTDLTLAVDSRNAPALKLYYRHGMQRVATRTALLRDLRAKRETMAALA